MRCIPLRRRSRRAALGRPNPKLLHQTEHIHLDPVLAPSAIFQTPDIAIGAAKAAARRWDAHEFSSMGAAEEAAGGYVVVGYDLILNRDVEVREGGAEHAVDDHEPFEALHRGREVMVDIRGMDEVVIQLGATLIHGILKDLP